MSTAYQLLEWSCADKHGAVMTVFFDVLDGSAAPARYGSAAPARWKPPTSDWSHVDHGAFATFDDALEVVKDSLIGHGMIGSAYRLATLPVDGGVKIWVVHDSEAAA